MYALMHALITATVSTFDAATAATDDRGFCEPFFGGIHMDVESIRRYITDRGDIIVAEDWEDGWEEGWILAHDAGSVEAGIDGCTSWYHWVTAASPR